MSIELAKVLKKTGVKYLYLFGKKVNRMVFEKIRISEKFWAVRSAAQKFSNKFFKIFPKFFFFFMSKL